MMKTRREILLGGVFAGLIAVCGLWEFFGAIALQPLSGARTSVDSARSNLTSLRDQATIIDQAVQNLKDLKAVGLPADPGRATVLYQGWLIQQLQDCAIDAPVVTPGPAIKEDGIGYRIPFVVQFAADSESVAELLDRFHSTPLLHRIANLQILRSARDESEHRVVLSIETLALHSSVSAQSVPDPIIADHDQTLAAMIAVNDFLGGPRTVEPMDDASPDTTVDASVEDRVAEAEQPTEQDPLSSVRFIASVWNGRQREAWLVDHRSMLELTVTESAVLSFPGIEGTVVFVGDDSMQLNINGQFCRIELGQALNQVSGRSPSSFNVPERMSRQASE